MSHILRCSESFALKPSLLIHTQLGLYDRRWRILETPDPVVRRSRTWVDGFADDLATA